MTIPNPTIPAETKDEHSMWTASRIIALVITVLEVMLFIRFALKLFGANQDQPLVAVVYAITGAFVAPFRGIFVQPDIGPVAEIATVLAIIFFALVAALSVAIVRAFTGKRSEASA